MSAVPEDDENKVHPDMWLLCWGLGFVLLYGLYQAWEIWINSP